MYMFTRVDIAPYMAVESQTCWLILIWKLSAVEIKYSFSFCLSCHALYFAFVGLISCTIQLAIDQEWWDCRNI